ncbi:hypothetical protein JCM11641_003091 [Rhodosporidiobolus odoratus]
MSVPSFAGAPTSRALIATTATASILAAVTSSQQYFHLTLVPHLTRDHQFYRFILHHFVYANSSELLLTVLILWYSAPTLERMFGTTKFANFLLVTTALSTFISGLLLVFGWQATQGRFNVLPSGPFAAVFAIVYQAHCHVPTMYHFKLFHPTLSLTNRFPLYLLSLLLLTSQLPSTLLLSSIGITSSLLYSYNFLGLKTYRLPRRLYNALASGARSVYGDPAKMKVKRGNAVTPEEALLLSLVGTTDVATGGAGFDLGALRGSRQQSASPQPASAETGLETAPSTAAAGPPTSPTGEGVLARPTTTLPVSPPSATAARPLPRIPGTNFLRQWQAGLTGAAEGPSPQQIAELSAIFPHHSRPTIVAALQQNGLSVARAAEAMVLSE